MRKVRNRKRRMRRKKDKKEKLGESFSPFEGSGISDIS